ncbi:MAG: transglycosylase domain-containing protein [Chloroflexota bacterium]
MSQTRGTPGTAPRSTRGQRAARRVLRRSRDAASSRRGGIIAPILAAIGIVLLLVVLTGGLLAGGGAAVMIAELERGLPEVQKFESLQYAEPSVAYDRTGKNRLATFFSEKRKVVAYRDIPQLVLDSTTSVEDRTFWENQGVDLVATLAALASDVSGADNRGGGSTITQQFVRARLLPPDLVNDPERLYERKAKEIIQSFKLTQAFPGETGKERIITAYLNQIFYGHNAYGISAAADVYFGKKLADLTPMEAALLAGLPQSPSILDPYRYAKEVEIRDENGNKRKVLEVPTCGYPAPPGCQDVAPVIRRDFILRSLAGGFGRWTTLSEEELQAALNEPIRLVGERPVRWQAPHFVWAMKTQLDGILADREPAERGGYRIVTTLDWKAQAIATRYVRAAAEFTQYDYTPYLRALRSYKVPAQDRPWLDFLRGKGLKNAALVAVDYRTGDVLAHVGSANYYGKNTRKMDPKFDVVQGYRQPGSAWKPIVFATAIDARAVTAGSVVLDVTTPFGASWDPKNAGLDERGPVLVRKALQYSLNIPAIRVIDRVRPEVVGQYSARAGITFLTGRRAMSLAGLAGAIGTVETRMLELASAYGAFGNDGFVTRPRFILKVTRVTKDSTGAPVEELIYEAGRPERTKFISPQAAYIMADILKGNTNPADNIYWGDRFQLNNGPGSSYRVAALKTGTTNDIRDVSAYGLLPMPQNPKDPAIALGVWMGNSDHSQPTLGGNPLFASDGPGEIWHAFLREYMKGEPAPDFQPPDKGLAYATIDSYSGGKPGPWTRDTYTEVFIKGTEPGAPGQLDPAGLIYTRKCGGWMVDPLAAENRGAPGFWKTAVRDWMARASRGVGRASGEFGTVTRYLEDRSSWGGPIAPSGEGCPTPKPDKSPDPSASPDPNATPDPDATPAPTPRRTPRPDRTPRPTRPPQETPRPTPPPTPNP